MRRKRWVVPVILGVLLFLAITVAVTDTLIQAARRKTFDAIAVPQQISMVAVHESGTILCVPSCLTISREYQSSLPRAQTFGVFAAELRRLDYECMRACDGIDSSGHSQVSAWSGSGPPLTLIVYGADTGAPPAQQPQTPGGSYAVLTTDR